MDGPEKEHLVMSNPWIATLSPEEKAELLKEISTAYFSGARRVRFRDRDVEYRSLEEMKRAIDELGDQVTGRRRQSVVLTSFGRGR